MFSASLEQVNLVNPVSPPVINQRRNLLRKAKPNKAAWIGIRAFVIISKSVSPSLVIGLK